MQKIIVILLASVLLFSCTKTITPTLNTSSPQVMVQGAVSDTAGPYYVSIVSSVGFYASNVYPGISGAVVMITDSSTGLRDSLAETSTGLYVTHSLLQGVHGHT